MESQPETIDPSEQGPKRKSFHQEVTDQSQEFAQQLMDEVPELLGVALVFAWDIPQEGFYPALIKGRNGPLQSPAEVMKMADQALRFNGHMVNEISNMLARTEQGGNDLARALEGLADRRDELQGEIRELEKKKADLVGDLNGGN
jgi:hypothetical protein